MHEGERKSSRGKKNIIPKWRKIEVCVSQLAMWRLNQPCARAEKWVKSCYQRNPDQCRDELHLEILSFRIHSNCKRTSVCSCWLTNYRSGIIKASEAGINCVIKGSLFAVALIEGVISQRFCGKGLRVLSCVRFFFCISLAPSSEHKISHRAGRALENEIPLRDASTYDFIQIDATAASQSSQPWEAATLWDFYGPRS